jgi:hypothetical protein
MFNIICLVGLITMCLGFQPSGAAEDRIGALESVKLSDDNSHITISYSGDIGPYSAFAMSNPNRIVVDLEKLGLGKVRPKIALDRDEIREIRAGASNDKTRVVVDFGDNPLPKFAVLRQDKSLVVRLQAAEFSPAAQQSARPKQVETPMLIGAPKRPKSGLSIKNAVLNGNRLTVEVTGGAGESYKLTVDIDPESKRIKEGLFKDPSGPVKKMQLTGTQDEEAYTLPREGAGRRTKGATNQAPGKKFKWGLQNASEDRTISHLFSKR